MKVRWVPENLLQTKSVWNKAGLGIEIFFQLTIMRISLQPPVEMQSNDRANTA